MLSLTCNVAEYETLATGLKVTLIVQLLPAASELPQFELGVSVNCAALVPVTDMPVIDSAVAPGLESVTVLVTLVFTVWVPKLRLVGLKLTSGLITVTKFY